MRFRVGQGQDSHRFDEQSSAPLVLAGVLFPDETSLKGNSDADVILHAVTNAVSSVTGINVIGATADRMCKQGITDSREYLKVALADMGDMRISHLAVCIECLTPKISPRINDLKRSLAGLLDITERDVGITATTGEGLTGMGKGEGVAVFATLTVMED